MKKLLFFLLILSTTQVFSQELTGKQLLEKTIQYHDPNRNWDTFKGTLWVTMKTPNRPNRDSEIKIDLPNQYFSVKATSGKNTTEYIVDKDSITIAFNGNDKLTDEVLKKNRLSKERANLYKNYYTYLYGLPMKLKDSGTIISETTMKKSFKGKEYLVLKVTYKKEVGKDTWYFYFNPKTYAMEVYQFFKDKPDSGEYILLTGEETINGIKIPKNRAWYFNKDNGYLGTDILKSSN